jgi:hypothetical protein
MAATVDGLRALMVIGKAGSFGCDALQLLAAHSALQVGAQPKKALLYLWLLQQMLNPQHTGMTELKAQPFVGFRSQAEFQGEAIKGVVHSGAPLMKRWDSGPHAHRRHRRDHGAGRRQRDLHRHEPLRERQALRLLAGPVSWAGTKITGGKVMSGNTKRCANRAAQALRLAAAALRSSQSALGAYYRRLCARMDKGKAVTAAAHKLARLIYAMLTKGEEYTDAAQDYFEERYCERVLRNLTKRARRLGMQIVSVTQPA